MKARLILFTLIVIAFSPLLRAQSLNRIPTPGGNLAGRITSPGGEPTPGVRMAAMDISDTLANDATLGVLVSITETDENGRYRLDNIPPGRYLISAGRVDIPTFYPGTTDREKAKPVVISNGSAITGIDFVMDDGSIRVYSVSNMLMGRPAPPSVFIPVDMKVEGGQVPVFALGKFPAVRFTRKGDGYLTEMKLDHASADLQLLGAAMTEYRVTVENLPDGYVVKSLRYGAIDATVDTIKITPPPGSIASYTAAVNAYNAFAAAQTAQQAAQPGLVNVNPLPLQQLIAPPTGPTIASIPVSTLSVTISAIPPLAPKSGVRITGHTSSNGVRAVYISGIPGIYFADGSFEFRGVPAGRQVVLLLDLDSSTSGLRGISVVLAARPIIVADQDIGNVELEPISMLPPDTSSLTTPGPASGHAPGPLPLAAIRGRVEDDAGKALGGGTVIIAGQARSMIRIGADGRFEIPHLLPGKYDLEIGNFAHETVRRTVDVEEGDIELNVNAAEL